MRLAVQTYLATHPLADLERDFHVLAKRHPQYPNLVLLKYNQIESPFAERIVQECRGLILDEADGWRVVSRAFDKFFNHGEGYAAPMDWATAQVQEKLDGSLCVLYHYADEWRVATTGTADAGGEVHGMGMTFADLFWRAFRSGPDGTLPLPREQRRCFAFELTSPYNRIVVRHTEPRVTLLAVRDRETGQEYPTEDYAHLYPTVRSFPLQTLHDIEATFANLDPLQIEGYVVVDTAFRRIKVKHPGYVAIHHLKDGFGPRRMLEIIRAGESSELLTHFPEWTKEFTEIEGRYLSLVHEIENDYDRLKTIPDRKAFALEAVKTRCSGALFCRRDEKFPTVRAFLADIQIRRLIDLLSLHDVEYQVGA